MVDNTTKVLKSIWEKLPDEERRKQLSHIRGVGDWQDIELWERQGKKSLENIRNIYRKLVRPIDGITVFEWGQGGGTNIAGVSSICNHFYSVDISESNVAEAKKIAKEYDVLFSPSLISSEKDIDNLPIKNNSIDVVLSTAVFQHFPSKEYAKKVLKAMHKTLKHNGIGIIQIRYQNEKFGKKSIKDMSEYVNNHIFSLLFTLDEFWELLKEVGFSPIQIHDINVGGKNYATYTFTKEG